MTELAFILQDRIGVIRSANNKYDLLANAYLSFSGGKDSTILHRLLDMALPGNKIPRVYIDTGTEYDDVRSFVFALAADDDRFVIIKPSKPIKPILEKYGYPFKSKEHSKKVDQYWRSKTITPYLLTYLHPKEGVKTRYRCPNCLLYQFTDECEVHFSHLCCNKLKKEPVKCWSKANHRSIAITGLRRDEGGQRANIKGCILTDSHGSVVKFHPLLVVSDEWEDAFIQEFDIKLCRLYYPPFNFKRTGCKGCPFSLDLQPQLSLMSIYLPKERAQCELIWQPVYKEYRRLGYRLDKEEQMLLF